MTQQLESPGFGETAESAYPIRFPDEHRAGACAQDQEWCEVYVNAEWRRMRLHDYDEIYNIPGLYEYLFGDLLRCRSPQRVVGLLGEVLRDWKVLPTQLSVIDLGAGNGMVGQQLRLLGIRHLVGADIIRAAADAVQRDRPGLYDDYIVSDFCKLSAEDRARAQAHAPNCLTSISALGFGDIPPAAFGAAFNLISTPGWLAFNIKESFLNGNDETGFSRLIRAMSEREIIQIQAYRRYSHRLSVAGKPLNYVALIARKLRPMPQSLPAEVQ
jgi:hypothetical protein